jgi:hypothetical protein
MTRVKTLTHGDYLAKIINKQKKKKTVGDIGHREFYTKK